MARRGTLSTRWVTVIMVAALVCSMAVVWSLIQLTGGAAASSSSSNPAAASDAAETASDGAESAGAGSPGAPSGSSRTLSGSTAGSAAGPAPSSALRTSDGRLTPSGSSATSSAAQRPSTPAPILLPGSALPLPAAWTGTAELTITVLGRCAKAGGTSSYTRQAELALQSPATGTGPIGDANPVSLTLGITPALVPGLSIYSAATGTDGTVRRTWWLATGKSKAPDPPGRTELSGVLIDDQPVDGVLPPNLLLDNETDLQPCEAGGSVRVPRILAAGSTLTGWVSPTAGHFDLKATTTDSERAVTAVIDLTRRVGT